MRWLTVATVAWAVLLAGLTWWSVRTDAPTVKEQRSLDQAGPVVDRAIGELTAAVGAAGVPALLPDRLERGCRITPMDDGATLERGVEVAIGGNDVREVLRGIADRLPSGWRAGVSTLDGEPLLRADAGEFVTVEGRSGGPGRVLLTADTGCRPAGSGYRAPSADAAAESAVLASAGPVSGEPPGADASVEEQAARADANTRAARRIESSRKAGTRRGGAA